MNHENEPQSEESNDSNLLALNAHFSEPPRTDQPRKHESDKKRGTYEL